MLGQCTTTALFYLTLGRLPELVTINEKNKKSFQELKSFSDSLKQLPEFSCKEGEKDVNRKKNRYKDILPCKSMLLKNYLALVNFSGAGQIFGSRLIFRSRCKPTHLTSVFSLWTSIFTSPHCAMLTAFADVHTYVAGC